MMRDRSTVFFLLALLALLTVLPLIHSWYTTNDDAYFAIGIDEGWRSPWIFDARRSGRIQHVLAGQLMPIAYGWGSYALGKAIGLATILSNVAALAVLVRVLTGDVRLALLAAVCFFAFVQNTWDHNLLTSYPFIIGSALTAYLLSVAAWWRALHGAPRMAIVSVVLFAYGLFIYESFMTYAVVFPVMTLAVAGGPWTERLVRAIRTPHVPVLAAFVVLLVLFKVFLHTPEGQAFNAAEQYEISLDPGRVWKTLERLGASSMPMHYFRAYRELVHDHYLGYGTYRPRLLEMFKVLDGAWLVKAAIVGFLVWGLTTAPGTVRRRGLVAVIGLVLLVLSNLPLAVTTKYQSWTLEQFTRGYVPSYLAFFGVVLLLGLALQASVTGLARRSSAAARTAAAVLAAAAFLVSYGTDFLNAHVVQTQRQVYDRWAAVDAWIASPAFAAIPDGSLVLAPSLWDRYPGATHVFGDYWTRYVRHYGKKQVQIFEVPAEWWTASQTADPRTLFHLRVIQERRDDATYLLFGPVASAASGAPLGVTDLTLIAHARSDHFRVMGRLYGADTSCRARIFVDGQPTSGTFAEQFGAHVDRPRSGEPWLRSRLSSWGALIDPESVVVTESTVGVDGPIDLTFDRGFHPGEVAYRWADREALLKLRNTADRDVDATLTVSVRSPAAAAGDLYELRVTVEGAETRAWPVGAEYKERTLQVHVPARSTIEVIFRTDAPKADLPLDPRTLVLMFLPELRVHEVGCDDRRASEALPQTGEHVMATGAAPP
jgi:hypothetical protein